MARELLSSDGSDSEDGGAVLSEPSLKVNDAYARRFEYNKKREERQRLEEQLGVSKKRKRDDEASDDSSDDSTSESEDEGELVTADLDNEILATISAIRSKDPRVYDSSTKFYAEPDEGDAPTAKMKKEKPMHLQDYHRQNLLSGNALVEAEEQKPLTYNEEQEKLKNSILGEINAAAADASSDDESEAGKNDDDFLTAKKREKTRPAEEPALDVDNADKDPETFLSNFMASRAWAQPTRELHPFDSDDSDDDKRADDFEEAYNMRFEDPAKSNEKLRTHARDFAAKHSVRREEPNPRQKRREAEKAKKETEKQERREDKARLRKLKIEELEEKVQRIKKAAGIRTSDLQPEDWSKFVNDDWDDEKWETEMQRRFGDEYYADEDVASEGDPVEAGEENDRKKRKVRKPKFDDDIDIKDIIPDFGDDDDNAQFSLTDEETAPKKAKKSHKQEKRDKQREAKKERRIIEKLVDDQLQYELNASISSNKQSSFRYRDSSPQSFGLSAAEILLAPESALNSFAGLKKLASYRDPEKKKKDVKNLGKKARLRKWRLETFGSEEGPRLADLTAVKNDARDDEQEDDASEGNDNAVDIKQGKKKKKRRRNKKAKVEEA